MTHNFNFKQRRAILLGVVIVLVTIFLIGNVSAANFDNIKHFDKDVGKYGKYEIRNSVLGIPFLQLSKVVELELERNTDSCGANCEAEQTITLYETGSLVDNVRFYNVGGEKETLTNINGYDFYVQDGIEQVEVDDYKIQCEEVYVPENKTTQKVCQNVKVGTHKEEVPKWIKINLGQEFEAGTYQVKLEGQKDPSETIDWQIKSNGIWTEEWAIWGVEGGLVSYYKLDESSGTVIDELGINDGTNYGATPNVAGKINTAYDFNGSTHISIGNNVFDALTLGSYSVSLWVKADTLSTNAIQYIPFDIEGRIMQFRSEESKWRVQSYDGATSSFADSTFNYNTGVWVHLAGVYNASAETLKLYVDGTLRDTAINVLTSDNSTDRDTRIGGAWSESYWDGKVDEIGIWNRTLTSDEVSALYNSGAGLAYNTEAGFVLNSPSNNYVSSNLEVKFNCSYDTKSALTITNMSLWTNETGSWELGNVTTGLSGTGHTQTWNRTFADADTILWTCRACASDNSCSFSPVNRTLTIDTSPPSINVETPMEL